MKKKLRQAIFTSYENEMHFRNECGKAKEGLIFSCGKKSDFPKYTIPALVTSVLCSLIIVSGHLAAHSLLSKNDKVSSIESISDKEKPNASLPFIDGTVSGAPEEMIEESITFYPFEDCILTFTFTQEDSILSIGSSYGIEVSFLTVSDDGEILTYQERLNGYQLKKKDEHHISWEYIEGEKIVENQFRIVR